MMLRRSLLVLGSSLVFTVAGCGSDNKTTGTGGARGTGGATGTGGGSSSTGGRSGTGGATSTGGGNATGGATGTGGQVGTGGVSTTGGASATGGRGGGNGGRGGGAGIAGTGGTAGAPGTANALMNFFVSSDTSPTANLGGILMADTRCQRLAAAVGQGSKTWRAYLSTANPLQNAIDRIGAGPYYNSAGVMIAATKAALHAAVGDHLLFIDEHGAPINGQWNQNVTPRPPVEHDVLTGTQRDGTLMPNNTCGDWTGTTGSSYVGHTDGEGPNMATTPANLTYWNGSHTGMCGDTAPGGGAGRIYCFVGP
jgi:hypothetical protein